jgi:hypothetical protein
VNKVYYSTIARELMDIVAAMQAGEWEAYAETIKVLEAAAKRLDKLTLEVRRLKGIPENGGES